MSGHRKWNNIKRKKEKTDAAKAKIFTKIGKEMAVAIRAGGPNPATNSKLKEGQEYRWERYNDNIGKWFDRTSSIIMLDGRPRHLEIGRDITARKEELSLLSGQLTMEDVLFRCLHTLTTEKDMDTAVNLFLEAVGGYYQANRSYICEFDLERQLLDNTFEWCAAGVSAEIAREALRLASHQRPVTCKIVKKETAETENGGE